ncbi:dockerin type I domain-containing protein [Ferruginibacter sp. HRS2-29]|uniref:dockerin type I domain-containing protein n=1 Tax=Ferruginibacter sp. HRS2-29 TaxID=2487334 RepID=UPI0020CCB5DE|nr:dockerin type I domain-containing protein [Ferruginibacter sp. HRS2-29]MCP9750659.1 hypothetical protein [Ferruginibacter sp. HRS2-29]
MRYKNLLPLLLLASLSSVRSQAQLYNNGASIKIQPGAVVFVAGDVQNNSSGTISNDGKLEVQGSFINNATYSSVAAEDSLILSGTGNVLLKGGASTINYLIISKSSNANTVTLSGTTLLGKKLDYTSGSFSTDPVNNPTYLFSAPVSAVFNYTAGREITGKVRRTSWTNNSTAVFNQTNMLVATNSGTAPTDFTVTMLPNSDPAQAEREVKRKFAFTQTGGSGFNTDVRFAYQDAELNTNLEPTLAPWQLVSGEWRSAATNLRDGSANFVATTSIAAADLGNEWKLADARYVFNVNANLRGAWNGTTAMNTTLNTNGLLPLTNPYFGVIPFNYPTNDGVGAIPNANVVDWILVELRKPATNLPEDAINTTIIGSKVGFILNDGSIVNTDGITPISFDINKQGAAFVVVRHRNHLGVISNSIPSNAAGTFANDFSAVANSYKPVGNTANPVVLLAGATGKYGLWPGDVNRNGFVNASDNNLIKVDIAASQSGYRFSDINMNGIINAADNTVTKATIAASGAGSGARAATIKTNLPDPITE